MSMSMSKTFIDVALCREFESEAPAAQEMLDPVVCTANCSVFKCALKVVTVAELFVTGDREIQTAGAVILNALDSRLDCKVPVAYLQQHCLFLIIFFACKYFVMLRQFHGE